MHLPKRIRRGSSPLSPSLTAVHQISVQYPGRIFFPEVWVVVADSILESATYRISMRWFTHGRSVRRLDGVSGADPRRQSPVQRSYSLCTGFHEQSRRLRCRGLIRAGAVKNNLAIGRPLLSVPGNVLQRYVEGPRYRGFKEQALLR